MKSVGKKRGAICLAVMSVLVFLLVVLPLKSDAEIYDKVIRLHVLANSDSEEDQALKLKVRDSLLVVAATTRATVNLAPLAKAQAVATATPFPYNP